MKTYLIHHTPKFAGQDTWAVSFSLPYISSQYVRSGDGVWYVKSWLTAEQIKKRLAILFDDQSELRIHELSRKESSLTARMAWLQGRLEDEEQEEMFSAPRMMWAALHSAMHAIVAPQPSPLRVMESSAENSRAA